MYMMLSAIEFCLKEILACYWGQSVHSLLRRNTKKFSHLWTCSSFAMKNGCFLLRGQSSVSPAIGYLIRQRFWLTEQPLKGLYPLHVLLTFPPLATAQSSVAVLSQILIPTNVFLHTKDGIRQNILLA